MDLCCSMDNNLLVAHFISRTKNTLIVPDLTILLLLLLQTLLKRDAQPEIIDFVEGVFLGLYANLTTVVVTLPETNVVRT